MVAVDASVYGGEGMRKASPAVASRPRRGGALWRPVLLLAVGAYFVLPFVAALRYALQSDTGKFSFSAFTGITAQQGFGPAIGLSLRLLVLTVALTLGLMVPTAVYVHLRLPRLRRILDGITILPIVVPPIVLVIGVLDVAPTFAKASPYLLGFEYVVLAMPFAYRSLAAGLAAIDVKTLFEASRSLGGGPIQTLRRVLVPNLRAALLSATVLTVALVLGEFTMASLDQYQTFPVWIVAFDQNNSHVSTAVSFLALFATWALLMVISLLDRRGRTPPAGGE